MTDTLTYYKDLIDQKLEKFNPGHQPTELYDPIRYILQLGGKRLRPMLVLMAARMFGKKPEECLSPAIAVEVFHNFTLMHDDIMDAAPLRRGQNTVHERWDANVAILSGDVMLIKAYELLMETDQQQLHKILQAFNQCATHVCEGQQWDMNFENRKDVDEQEYLKMITLKTAVLLGFALQLGGILAHTTHENQENLKAFGINLGLAFQLKDDLLDTYSDPEKFGKQIGGDIVANKKTFLLIKAFELADDHQLDELKKWISDISHNNEEKITAVKSIFNQLNIEKITGDKIDHYYQLAYQSLDALNVPETNKSEIKALADYLMNRET